MWKMRLFTISYIVFTALWAEQCIANGWAHEAPIGEQILEGIIQGVVIGIIPAGVFGLLGAIADNGQ